MPWEDVKVVVRAPVFKAPCIAPAAPFFRLHFLNLYGSAKQVFTAMSSPFINVFSHRRRRRDREDGCQFRKGIGDMGGCLVAIHCLKNFLCHNTVPLSVKHRNLKESVYTLESSHYIARTK